ncbi:MAG: hypothetical protein IPM60_12660 [Rhodospirillales bacterium]|nr:hypothetical protein [Rhodospirillales bacterium]
MTVRGAGKIVDLFMKLLPAAALLPALFVLDGGLRWIGLLGLIPLAFAFVKGCPVCAVRHGGASQIPPGWTPFAGH